jgi:hypothetical protein
MTYIIRKTATLRLTFLGVNAAHHESNLIPACLPTPNPSSPDFSSRFRADIVQLVEASNVHKHSDTCYKYWNPSRGEAKTCRMRMPRKLVPISTIDPDTGCISMRRSDPWINNFNEYLIAACRSNMDIKFIWSGNDAKALVYYITDYVTKMSLSFHDTFSLVQKGIASFENAPLQTNCESAIEKSRKLVLRCYNTLASQQELSGVQVASYLMNWGDHYTTHKFQGLLLIQTERYLQTELDEIRSKEKSMPPVHGKCINHSFDLLRTLIIKETIVCSSSEKEYYSLQIVSSIVLLTQTNVILLFKFSVL